MLFVSRNVIWSEILSVWIQQELYMYMFMCNINASGVLGYAHYAVCLRTVATFYVHHKCRKSSQMIWVIFQTAQAIQLWPWKESWRSRLGCLFVMAGRNVTRVAFFMFGFLLKPPQRSRSGGEAWWTPTPLSLLLSFLRFKKLYWHLKHFFLSIKKKKENDNNN